MPAVHFRKFSSNPLLAYSFIHFWEGSKWNCWLSNLSVDTFWAGSKWNFSAHPVLNQPLFASAWKRSCFCSSATAWQWSQGVGPEMGNPKIPSFPKWYQDISRKSAMKWGVFPPIAVFLGIIINYTPLVSGQTLGGLGWPFRNHLKVLP